MTARWWLEIGPLKEGNFTGISQVTAAIAAEMLGDPAREAGFFYGRAEIDADIVQTILERRNGELLEWYLARARPPAAPASLDATNIAIFPNRKTCRRGFDIETQIIHDLSTLLTPQYHHPDTIAYHALSLKDDVASNDITFCVSESTREDTLLYLGPLDPARVVTIPLGVEDTLSIVPRDAAVEPYVLVLGTIEPRKNVEMVLRFIAAQPHILRSLRFVFLGRYGWGDSVEALVGRHCLHEPFQAGRILFPGYIADAAKQQLLLHARLLIYPSLFEGFGLPVAEALALGTPCLTTRSSSLPEVGGDVCSYFDPFDEDDFGRAFAGALHDTRRMRAARHGRAAQFTWQRAWRLITGAVAPLLESRTQNPTPAAADAG